MKRLTYYNWIEKDPKFKEECETVQEIALDLAEERLMDLIEAKDVTAIIFYLKTRGKKRGYVERQELDARVAGGMLNLNIQVADAEAGDMLRKIVSRNEDNEGI